MNAQAPIRQLSFYAHGVAQITREARFEGSHLSLALKPSELDDVLKSCVVSAATAETIVSGMDYETPAPAASGSASVSTARLNIGKRSALVDLLTELMGWDVQVALQADAPAVAGRVLGIQLEGPEEAQCLLLSQPDTGLIQRVLLADIRQLLPQSPSLQARLGRELDARQQPDGVQALTIRVNPGQHHVAVAYLVPSSSWRISYRASVTTDAGDSGGPAIGVTHGKGPAQVRLQAWGLIDNQFGEDLNDVRISMVAGQPISFQYAMALPVQPDRVKVAAPARQAAKPLDFQAPAPIQPRSPMDLGHLIDPCMIADLGMQEALTTPAAQTHEQGELFEYEVAQPVSMPMGSSALVPLFDLAMPGERELLFNDRKHKLHPIRALRCINVTGCVLEHGPLTVTEDGSYRGEAVLPFTVKGAELYLPYAMELGIHVTVDTHSGEQHTTLTTGEGAFWEESAGTKTLRWTLHNKTEKDDVVTIECDAFRLPGELTCQAGEPLRVAHVLRWRVPCPAQSEVSFQVSAHSVSRQRLGGLPALEKLKAVLGASLCPLGLAQALQPLLPMMEEQDTANARLKQLDDALKELAESQEELRGSIEMLSGSDSVEVAARRELIPRALELASSLSAQREERAALRHRHSQLQRQLFQATQALLAPQA